jgi:hypothetical protein
MAYMLLDKAARKVFHAQGHRDPTQGLDTTADVSLSTGTGINNTSSCSTSNASVVSMQSWINDGELGGAFKALWVYNMGHSQSRLV